MKVKSHLAKTQKHRAVYLVKDGHVATDKTISHNLSNPSGLILINWYYNVKITRESYEDEDDKNEDESYDDEENLHWHADVEELTIVALICIVPDQLNESTQ